jgi:hypothetical protein
MTGDRDVGKSLLLQKEIENLEKDGKLHAVMVDGRASTNLTLSLLAALSTDKALFSKVMKGLPSRSFTLFH